jgi:hypothetical protein
MPCIGCGIGTSFKGDNIQGGGEFGFPKHRFFSSCIMAQSFVSNLVRFTMVHEGISYTPKLGQHRQQRQKWQQVRKVKFKFYISNDMPFRLKGMS